MDINLDDYAYELLDKISVPAFSFEYINPKYLDQAKASNNSTVLERSFIGGKPYLPASFEWPIFCADDDEPGYPLVFIAQFDLSELKPYRTDPLLKRLPDHGILAFFYAEDNATKVLYFEDTSNLQYHERPESDASEDDLYIFDEGECPLINLKVITSKSVGDPLEYPPEVLDWVKQKSNLTDDDIHKISEQFYELMEACELDVDFIKEDVVCNLLGVTQYIQGSEFEEDQCLLFRLGSFFCAQDHQWILCIGDAGDIYFHITNQELQNLDFSNVTAVMQCY